MTDRQKDAVWGVVAFVLCVAMALVWGCTPVPQTMPPEHRAVGAAVLRAWADRGLPAPETGRGGCDVASFRVRHPLSEQAYYERCSSTSADSAGCLNWDATSHFFRPVAYPVVVVAPTWQVTPDLIAHELLHALYHCSHLRGEYTGDNRYHLDPRVWEAAGGADSVQARARSLLSR